MNTPTTVVTIDLTQRPKTYFWPLGLETQLLTHIKGAARRAVLQKFIAEGRLDELPEYLAREKLSDEERAAIARIHPRLMGGEFLPDQDEGEVEIARIEIASTTFDVTSVYARREDGRIHYRVVDEYGGDTLTDARERTSREPLTLGELYAFFMDAWPLGDVLEMNSFAVAEEALGFFTGRSEFYPEFDALLRARTSELFPPADQDDESGDDDDESDD
jgi:hypothetical protein